MTTAPNPSALSNEKLDELIDTTWNDTTMITAACTASAALDASDLTYLARELSNASEIPEDGWTTITTDTGSVIKVVPMMDSPDRPQVRAFLLKIHDSYFVLPAMLIADDSTRTLIDTHLRVIKNQKD